MSDSDAGREDTVAGERGRIAQLLRDAEAEDEPVYETVMVRRSVLHQAIAALAPRQQHVPSTTKEDG